MKTSIVVTVIELLTLWLQIGGTQTTQADVCADLQTAPVLDVVIVGAGAAGIVAFQQIYTKASRNVTVLEARDRIGGRVYTITEADSPLEMGAQYIHGVIGNSVYEYASNHSLVVDEAGIDGEEEYYLENGNQVGAISVKSAKRLFNNMKEVITKKNDHSSSVGQQLQKGLARLSANVYNEEVKRMVEFNWKDASADFGDDIMYENVDEESKYHENKGAQNNVPKEGYQTIFDSFLNYNKLPTSLFQYQAVVKTVYWQINCGTGNRFNGLSAVRLANGTLIAARYTLVTVPLGVLKAGSIEFVPAFSSSSINAAKNKATAISRLGFGCICKVFIRWPEQWWNDGTSVVGLAIDSSSTQPDGIQVNQSLYTNPGDKLWYRNVDAFNNVYNQDDTLEAWFVGKWARVVESLPESEVQSVLIQLLRKFSSKAYPNIPDPVKTIRTQWCQDEFSKGTYSMLTMESHYEDISALAASLPNATNATLLFAGEATNNQQWSTVNAAWQSGTRAGMNIVRLLKGIAPR